MNRYYIAPEEVNASNTGIILNFFNSVEKPEVIASTIELPDTLDIGINLARAILEQRKKNGGRFENLQQIADVPYIGDERFTEIVTALTGMTPEGETDPDLSGKIRTLQLQLNTLKSQIENKALLVNESNSWQVFIQAVPKEVYIGQAVKIIIHVINRLSREPGSSMKVNMSTPWGILKYQAGFKHYQNSALSVVTDLSGKAEIEFRSPSYEALNVSQQMALESKLIILKRESTTPNQLGKELIQLVDAYRNPLNKDLRKAIDIYFQIHKPMLMESVNRRLFNNEWQYFNTVIHASLVDEQDKGVSDIASASLILSLRDWLAPWFQTYLDMILKNEALLEETRGITEDKLNKSVLLSRILENMNSYVKSEPGIAGAALGFRKAEIITEKFLSQDIQSLPAEIQNALFPVLTIARDSLAGSSLGTLEALSQTKVELKNEIEAREIKGIKNIKDLKLTVDNFQGRLGELDSRFGEFQSDISTFNKNISAFDKKYFQFENDYAEFSLSRDKFDENISRFDTDFEQFNSDYLNFKSEKITLDSSLSVFQIASRNVADSISEFNLKNTEITKKLSDFSNSSAAIKKEMGDFMRIRRP